MLINLSIQNKENNNMFYLQEALDHLNRQDSLNLEACRSSLYPHIQSIKTIEEFNQYYRVIENRFMSAFDDFQLAMQFFRNADMEDVYSRFSSKLELIQAESRLESFRNDLKELASLFAINHYEQISGFELNSQDYDNTVDSANVSLE